MSDERVTEVYVADESLEASQVVGGMPGDTHTEPPAGDESTDEIRRDIEQTRYNMSQTIDTIQDRLSPQHLADQAKGAIREATIGKAEHVMNDVSNAARDTGSGIMAAIRQNPLPAALAGIGLGWLFMQARGTGAQQRSSRQLGYLPMSTGGGYPRSAGYPGYQTGATGRPVGDQASNAAGQLASKAQDAAGQISDQAQQMGGWVQDQAQQVADQAQNQAYQIKGWFERTLDESPLVLGLVALAAGSVLGLAVPETPQEHQMMGPARDNLVQQAEGAAQGALDKVQKVSDQAQKAAKQEAQKQQLM
jgi:hypothetical protein